MRQHKGIIAAGIFAGLLVISLLALGIGGLGTVSGNTDNVLPESSQPTVAPAVNIKTAEAWQQHSAELELALRTMQAREAAYQTQIEIANQTINQLQDELNAGGSRFYFEDDEQGEHENHEEFGHYDD